MSRGQKKPDTKINPIEFAAALEQLSMQFLPAMTAQQLQMDQGKKGQRGALDEHINTQEKLQQFIVLDLLKRDDKKSLQKAFNYYVEVLKTCMENHDYQSASTILGALNSIPIRRLRKEEFVLTKVGEKPTIKKNDTSCIGTTSSQREFLSDVEMFFDFSNISENYRKKSASHREANENIVPMVSTIAQTYAQAVGGSKTYKTEEIDLELTYYQNNAKQRINPERETNWVYQHLSNYTTLSENEFIKLTEYRSKEILPRGSDASAFEDTKPFKENSEAKILKINPEPLSLQIKTSNKMKKDKTGTPVSRLSIQSTEPNEFQNELLKLVDDYSSSKKIMSKERKRSVKILRELIQKSNEKPERDQLIKFVRKLYENTQHQELKKGGINELADKIIQKFNLSQLNPDERALCERYKLTLSDWEILKLYEMNTEEKIQKWRNEFQDVKDAKNFRDKFSHIGEKTTAPHANLSIKREGLRREIAATLAVSHPELVIPNPDQAKMKTEFKEMMQDPTNTMRQKYIELSKTGDEISKRTDEFRKVMFKLTGKSEIISQNKKKKASTSSVSKQEERLKTETQLTEESLQQFERDFWPYIEEASKIIPICQDVAAQFDPIFDVHGHVTDEIKEYIKQNDINTYNKFLKTIDYPTLLFNKVLHAAHENPQGTSMSDTMDTLFSAADLVKSLTPQTTADVAQNIDVSDNVEVSKDVATQANSQTDSSVFRMSSEHKLYKDPIEQLISGWSQTTSDGKRRFTPDEFNNIAAGIIYDIPPQNIIDKLANLIKSAPESDQKAIMDQSGKLISAIRKVHPDVFKTCDLSQLKPDVRTSESLKGFLNNINRALQTPSETSTMITRKTKSASSTHAKPFDLASYLEGDMKKSGRKKAAKIYAHDIFMAQAKLLSQLQADELVNQNWTRNKAPTIQALSNIENGLIAMVQQDILFSAEKHKQQKCYRFYTELMNECLKHNDFPSAIAIYMGLNKPSIERLDYLQDGRAKILFQRLTELSNPSGNYKAYKNAVKDLGDQPFIPIISIHTQELTFADEGNPDTILIQAENPETKVLNLEKTALNGSITAQVLDTKKQIQSIENLSAYTSSSNVERIKGQYLEDDVAYVQSLVILSRNAKENAKEPIFSPERIDKLKQHIPNMNKLQKKGESYIAEKIKTSEGINAHDRYQIALQKGKKEIAFEYKLTDDWKIKIRLKGVDLSGAENIPGREFMGILSEELRNEGYTLPPADQINDTIELSGTDIIKFGKAAGMTEAEIISALEGKSYLRADQPLPKPNTTSAASEKELPPKAQASKEKPPKPKTTSSRPSDAESDADIQTRPRHGGAVEPPKPDDPRKLTRQRILAEMVNTEESYLKSLAYLVDNQKEIIDIINNNPNMSQEDKKTYNELIGIIQSIYTINKENILPELQALQKIYDNDETSAKDFSDCMEKLSKHAQISTVFYGRMGVLYEQMQASANKFTASVKNNKELSAQYQITKLLDDKGFQPGQGLQSIVIQPIQRFPRYKDLTATLLKHTADTHPGHQTASALHEKFKEQADNINSRIKNFQQQRTKFWQEDSQNKYQQLKTQNPTWQSTKSSFLWQSEIFSLKLSGISNRNKAIESIFEKLNQLETVGEYPISVDLQEGKTTKTIQVQLKDSKEPIATLSLDKKSDPPSIIVKNTHEKIGYDQLEMIHGIVSALMDETMTVNIVTKDKGLRERYEYLQNGPAATVTPKQKSDTSEASPVIEPTKREPSTPAQIQAKAETRPRANSDSRLHSSKKTVRDIKHRHLLPEKIDSPENQAALVEKIVGELHRERHLTHPDSDSVVVPLPVKPRSQRAKSVSISSSAQTDSTTGRKRSKSLPTNTERPDWSTLKAHKLKASEPVKGSDEQPESLPITELKIGVQERATDANLEEDLSQKDKSSQTEKKVSPISVVPNIPPPQPLLIGQRAITSKPLSSEEFSGTQQLTIQKLHVFAVAHQKAFEIETIKKLPEKEGRVTGLEINFKRDDPEKHSVAAHAYEGENQDVKFAVSKNLFNDDKDAAREAILKMCRLVVNAAEPNAEFNIPEKLADDKRDIVKACFNQAIQEVLERPETKFTRETLPKVIDQADKSAKQKLQT